MRRFFLDVFQIGITVCPTHIVEVLQKPDDHTDEEKLHAVQMIDGWVARGAFVLWTNATTDFWLGSDGEIEAA